MAGLEPCVEAGMREVSGALSAIKPRSFCVLLIAVGRMEHPRAHHFQTVPCRRYPASAWVPRYQGRSLGTGDLRHQRAHRAPLEPAGLGIRRGVCAERQAAQGPPSTLIVGAMGEAAGGQSAGGGVWRAVPGRLRSGGGTHLAGPGERGPPPAAPLNLCRQPCLDGP